MLLSEDPIVEGFFLKRPNRFIAHILCMDKTEVIAHVPNTGRMGELLIPGVRVKMAWHPSEKRKTDYTLLAVLYRDTWVCVYAAMANAIAAEYMAGQPDISDLKREVAYGNSRFDLGFIRCGVPALAEVKSVNLVIDGKAMFPDAPTSRGSKHLIELMKARREGYEAGVLFVVMRSDADDMMPNRETDPVFAAHLAQCQAQGVWVKAIRCRIEENEIRIDRPIPVDL